MIDSPLFILGVQRSCTTLLARMIAIHDDVLLTINGKLLYYLITWVGRDPSPNPGGHLRLDEIVHSLTRKPILGISEESATRMRRALLAQCPACRFDRMDRREIVRTVWSEIYEQAAAGRSVVGDKYNEYMLQLPEILSLFPASRFVLLHRDPLAVAESMIRVFRGRPWAPETPYQAIRKWTEWNLEWLRWRPSIPPSRRVEVAAALLLERPAAVLRSVCSLVGIESNPTFLASATSLPDRSRAHTGVPLDIDWGRLDMEVPGFQEVLDAFGYRSSILEGRWTTASQSRC